MSEYPREKKEKDWSDSLPAGEEAGEEPREKTYRDGSAVNECWAAEREDAVR